MFNRSNKIKRRRPRRSLIRSWREYRKERAKRKEMRAKMSRVRKKLRKKIWEERRASVSKFLRNPLGRKKLSSGDRLLREHYHHELIEHWKRMVRNSPSMLAASLRSYLRNQKEQLAMLRERFDYSIAPLVRRENSKELRADMMKTALNSTVAFVVAFWVVYFTGQVVTIWTASLYSIPAILHSFITEWPLYEFSPLYTRRNLILIFGTGPLACLVIAFLVYRLFLIAQKRFPAVKLFLVWMIFNGIAMFFAAYIAGVITRSGLVYSSAWIFLSRPYDIEEIIFMILAVIILVSFGFVITRLFIMASMSVRIINPYIRVYYMLSAVVVPFVLGNLIVFMTNFPKNPLNFILLQGFSLLMVLPTVLHFNSPNNQRIRLPKPLGPVRTAWIVVLIFAALTLVIRFFIYPGIQFS